MAEAFAVGSRQGRDASAPPLAVSGNGVRGPGLHRHVQTRTECALARTPRLTIYTAPGEFLGSTSLANELLFIVAPQRL